jgi:hypothetical protein
LGRFRCDFDARNEVLDVPALIDASLREKPFLLLGGERSTRSMRLPYFCGEHRWNPAEDERGVPWIFGMADRDHDIPDADKVNTVAERVGDDGVSGLVHGAGEVRIALDARVLLVGLEAALLVLLAAPAVARIVPANRWRPG